METIITEKVACYNATQITIGKKSSMIKVITRFGPILVDLQTRQRGENKFTMVDPVALANICRQIYYSRKENQPPEAWNLLVINGIAEEVRSRRTRNAQDEIYQVPVHSEALKKIIHHAKITEEK